MLCFNIYTNGHKDIISYEKNKPAIYKWRDLNKEKYNYNDISDKAQAIGKFSK